MSRSWVKMFTANFSNQLEDKINKYIDDSDNPIRVTAIDVINHSAYACWALVAFETVEEKPRIPFC